jgi:hypothetical protein
MNKYSDRDLELSDTDHEHKVYKTSKFSKKHKFHKSKSRSRSRDDTDVENDDFEFTNDPEELVYIKEFNMNDMMPRTVEDKGTKIVVIGKPGTGKSSLIQDIVAHKAHIIPVSQIFSGTEESNHFYSEKFPPISIYNKLDMGAVKQFIDRQDNAKKFLKNPWALQIIDDCTDNPRILKDPVFQAYYKNGRHWKMLHILSLQYCLDVSPAIRTCIDYTFILKEGSKLTREKLWKNYGSCIEDFADFCQLMDQLTNDFTALVINNRATSNKLEDCVFYYKADLSRVPVNWKFGAGSFWQYNHDRFNSNFVESFY